MKEILKSLPPCKLRRALYNHGKMEIYFIVIYLIWIVDCSETTRNDPFYWDEDGVWTREYYFITYSYVGIVNGRTSSTRVGVFRLYDLIASLYRRTLTPLPKSRV